MCRIRAEWGCVRVVGTVGNTLKGGGTEKKEGETKILKRGGKLGQGVGALKKIGGAGTPLRTMMQLFWFNPFMHNVKWPNIL